jgi:hypothetical protein
VTKADLPHFAESEFNEKLQKLFDYIQHLEGRINWLEEENRRLKGLPAKPNLSPAKPLAPSPLTPDSPDKKKRGGSKPGARRQKTAELEIHRTQRIQPDEEIPEGAVFKGYQDFVVQDLEIHACNTLYQLARWETPDGDSVIGKLPLDVKGHFGVVLRSYILHQHNQCRVTEPLLLEQLHEFGVEISKGQLHSILTDDHEPFHQEKEDILKTGLQASSFIQVDDTGARHAGKNGYCTVICNPYFAYFETTNSKSRINFLQILRGKHQGYEITPESLEYAKSLKLPQAQLECLQLGVRCEEKEQWEVFLEVSGIHQELHIRIATEAALIGSLMRLGFNPNLAILSDDAGQFDIFLHALCWIHAERKIKELEPYTPEQQVAVQLARSQIWDLYNSLRYYKTSPSQSAAKEIEEQFETIFKQATCYVSLNCALKRLYANKEELLLVLQRPEIPLHNNQSESDIREKVQRRKISVTFSDRGKQCRDTFSSLKKTCKKNGISFWKYLIDRLSHTDNIGNLAEIVRLSTLSAHPIRISS